MPSFTPTEKRIFMMEKNYAIVSTILSFIKAENVMDKN